MTAKRRSAAAAAVAVAAFPKKTRDIHDLCLCHGCRHRFPSLSNAKIGDLRTLDSEWRVVLLCRRCYGALRSGAACSYCFAQLPPAAAGDPGDGVFCCRQCSRRVHLTCIRLQSGSISSLDLDPATASASFVCVDCCAFTRCRSRNPNVPNRAAAAARGEEKVPRKAEAAAEKAREAFDGLAVRCSSSDPGRNAGLISGDDPCHRFHSSVNGSMKCNSQKDEGGSCSNNVNGSEQLAWNSEALVSSECSAVEGDCSGIREKDGSCAPDRYLKKYCRRRRWGSKGAGGARESPPCLVGCSESSSSFRDSSYQPFEESKTDARVGMCSLEKITTAVEKESFFSKVEEAGRFGKSNGATVLLNCGSVGGDCIQIRGTGWCSSTDGYLKKYSRRRVNSKGLDVIKECPPISQLDDVLF